MEIAGMAVTLIDTAGLRDAQDEIERMGIERGAARAQDADLRIYLKSSPEEQPEDLVVGDIVLLSKADVWKQSGISSATGAGIADLLDQIQVTLSDRVKGSSIFIRERHFDKLSRAVLHIESAKGHLGIEHGAWELASEELRGALRCLDGIVGRVDVEDVLGRIFSSFCIGK